MKIRRRKYSSIQQPIGLTVLLIVVIFIISSIATEWRANDGGAVGKVGLFLLSKVRPTLDSLCGKDGAKLGINLLTFGLAGVIVLPVMYHLFPLLLQLIATLHICFVPTNITTLKSIGNQIHPDEKARKEIINTAVRCMEKQLGIPQSEARTTAAEIFSELKPSDSDFDDPAELSRMIVVRAMQRRNKYLTLKINNGGAK